MDIGGIGVAVTDIAATRGVDPSTLPVAASAPEYPEQKAVADEAFAVAFGLLLHLSPVPQVTGAPLLAKVLTNDVESLTGGKVFVELVKHLMRSRLISTPRERLWEFQSECKLKSYENHALQVQCIISL